MTAPSRLGLFGTPPRVPSFDTKTVVPHTLFTAAAVSLLSALRSPLVGKSIAPRIAPLWMATLDLYLSDQHQDGLRTPMERVNALFSLPPHLLVLSLAHTLRVLTVNELIDHSANYPGLFVDLDRTTDLNSWYQDAPLPLGASSALATALDVSVVVYRTAADAKLRSKETLNPEPASIIPLGIAVHVDESGRCTPAVSEGNEFLACLGNSVSLPYPLVSSVPRVKTVALVREGAVEGIDPESYLHMRSCLFGMHDEGRLNLNQLMSLYTRLFPTESSGVISTAIRMPLERSGLQDYQGRTASDLIEFLAKAYGEGRINPNVFEDVLAEITESTSAASRRNLR